VKEGKHMGRKRRNVTETATVLTEDNAAIVELAETPSAEEPQPSPDLTKDLSEICKREGVLGFIIRDASTATIDLKNPEKIVEYALLSSQALEFSQELSQLFSIGEFRSVIIEGRDIKVLCIMVGESRINVFMEKSVDHADLLYSIARQIKSS
jgi:predicted regulator of Ras-like GTPase activity (Roadblock/LC7/MglB family)